MRLRKGLDLYYNRLRWLKVIIIITFLLLFARYWYLQVIRGPEYFILSEQNRIRVTTLPAARGLVLDRYGNLLAKNRPSYNIVLYRSNISGKIEEIAEFLGLEKGFIKERIEKYSDIPISEPVIIMEDIPFEALAKIEPRMIDYPNLAVEVEPMRDYPLCDEMVHILGYVGEVSEAEIESNIFPGVESGDLVGKSGIERRYDNFIRGIEGERTDVVDSRGRKVENLLSKEPQSGNTLILTIDSDLQKRVNELMTEEVGAAVCMIPTTGEILAMVSKPSYNPNPLVGRFTREKWQELINAENDPLQNRTIQNNYPPGSMFKIVIALAGLQEKTITENTAYYCYGAKRFYGKISRCNKASGHGRMQLYDAIRLSCNIYFYSAGDKLGIERISEYAKRFGFGSRTDVDLVEEKAGLVPNPPWKKQALGKPWYPGETISVSIGQGALQITPIQQAVFISAVANGGKLLRPFVVKKITDRSGSEERETEVKIQGLLGIDEEHLNAVRKAMWGVVNDYGTGWGAKIFGRDVAGKTGTAQVVLKDTYSAMEEIPWKLRNHSWFSCFSPLDHPEIVVVVFVEHGGDGSRKAAPIAGKILREYYKLKRMRMKEKEKENAA